MRKSVYRWVVVFKDGRVRQEPVAKGYREAMWFACAHANRDIREVREVQRHLTNDDGFIYKTWRIRNA